LLRVDPERRFLSPPSKAGRSAELTPKPWRRRMGQLKTISPKTTPFLSSWGVHIEEKLLIFCEYPHNSRVKKQA
jgi:hypothetical protein